MFIVFAVLPVVSVVMINPPVSIRTVDTTLLNTELNCTELY